MARSISQMEAATTAAVDQIHAAVREHEVDAHGGGVCDAERFNVAAYVAHRFGIQARPKHLAAFIAALRVIEAGCPDCGHGDRDADAGR